MDLLTKLKACGEAANSLTGYMLNYGGCCVYAAAICAKLNAMGIRAEVCTPIEDYDEPFASAAEVRQFDRIEGAYCGASHGMTFFHVGVVFEHEGLTWVYDSDMLRNDYLLGLGDGYVVSGLGESMTAEEAQCCADDFGFWNRHFDRSLIPQLLSLIDSFFPVMEVSMQVKAYRGHRFVVKFNNGTYKVFDMLTYRDVRPFDTKKQAEGFADRQNGSDHTVAHRVGVR